MNLNSIPEMWYLNIRKGTTPNAMAILMLWDFVYWYKWTEVRDEESGMLIGHKKKFTDKDWLQRSHDQIGKKFGISKKVVRENLDFLEELGLIKKHCKGLHTNMGVIPNVLYIELCPEAIKKFSFEKVELKSVQSGKAKVPSRAKQKCPNGNSKSDLQGSTNTNNSTTNSTAISTPSEDSSLRSESSSAPHDTGERKNSEKEGGTPLANKNLNSENSCEESETDKQIQIPNESNSDLSADEPCPWDAPGFMGMIKGSKYKSDGKTPQRRKRTPLAEREPVNDIERVEKAYITALADAEKLSPGVTEKSYTGFRNISAQRKRIKDWLKDYSAAEMAQAIRLAAQDNFCRNTLNMVFSSLLSDKIMTRLLNGDIRASPKKSEFSKPHEGFKDGQRDYSNTADW